MNLSIRPNFSQSIRTPANLIRANGLPGQSAVAGLRAAPLNDPGDPFGGSIPTPPTNAGVGGAGKAAKESKGFFGKIGSFFSKVGGFFKEIGTRMGRGIRDGVKTLFWEPLKKHVLAPIGRKIVDGVKELGSLIKKAWPF